MGCYRKQVIILDCEFKNISWSRISFTDKRSSKLSLVKCRQALSNWINKCSLFCFCKCLWIVDLRISFCIKSAKPDYNSELSSVDTAWDFSREHWWDLITFESILLLEILIVSKVVSPFVQMESWARCLVGLIFSCFSGNRIYFLAYLTQFGKEGLVYSYLFTSQREFHFVPRYGFFCYTFTYFVPFGVVENAVTKVNSKYFNGNCDHFICPGCLVLFLYAPE